MEIKAGDALKGDIEIRYKGQPVSNLFVARATLKNTGTLPIRKADVIEPLAFTFGNDTELVRHPQISSLRPKNLKVAWKFDTTGSPAKVNVAQLDFDLLNPGDELTAEFVCTGKSSLPKLTTRIEGVSDVDLLDSQVMRWKNEIKTAVVFGGGVMLLMLVLIAIFPSTFGTKPGSSLSWLSSGFITGATAGILQAVSPTIKLLRHRRKGTP